MAALEARHWPSSGLMSSSTNNARMCYFFWLACY